MKNLGPSFSCFPSGTRLFSMTFRLRSHDAGTLLKTVKNVTVAKFELPFTRWQINLKTIGNFTVKTLCKILMPKTFTYILTIDPFRSKSVEKWSVFIIFECSHDAVSKMCRLEFRFQNLPFSKSVGKNVPLSCEQEAYSSHFPHFQICRYRVNTVFRECEG